MPPGAPRVPGRPRAPHAGHPRRVTVRLWDGAEQVSTPTRSRCTPDGWSGRPAAGRSSAPSPRTRPRTSSRVRAHRRGRRRAVDPVLAARAPRPLALRVARSRPARAAARRARRVRERVRERRQAPPAPRGPRRPSRGVPRRLPGAAARRAAADRARARAAPRHPARGPRGAASCRCVTRPCATGGATARLVLDGPDGWDIDPPEPELAFAEPGDAHTVRFSVAVPRSGARGLHRCATGSASPELSDGVVLRPVRRGGSGLTAARDGGQLRRRGARRQPGLGGRRPVDAAFVGGLRYGYVPGIDEQILPSLERFGLDVRTLSDHDLTYADLGGVRRDRRRAARVQSAAGRAQERGAAPRLRARRRHADRAGAGVRLRGRGIRALPVPLPPAARPRDQARRAGDPPPRRSRRAPDAQRDPRGGLRRAGCTTAACTSSASGIAATRRCSPCADPATSPSSGGLLVAAHGRGTYVYSGYSFFRQIPAGVPGAIRLFANLLGHPARAHPRARASSHAASSCCRSWTTRSCTGSPAAMSERWLEAGAVPVPARGTAATSCSSSSTARSRSDRRTKSDRRVQTVLEAGEVIGELAVLTDAPRSASLRAPTETRLLSMQDAALPCVARGAPAARPAAAPRARRAAARRTRLSWACGSACSATPAFGGSAQVALDLAQELALRGPPGAPLRRAAPPLGVAGFAPGVAFHRIDGSPDAAGHRLDTDWPAADVDALAERLAQLAVTAGLDVLHFHYALPFAQVAAAVRERMGAARARPGRHAARHRRQRPRAPARDATTARAVALARRRDHDRVAQPRGPGDTDVRAARAAAGDPELRRPRPVPAAPVAAGGPAPAARARLELPPGQGSRSASPRSTSASVACSTPSCGSWATARCCRRVATSSRPASARAWSGASGSGATSSGSCRTRTCCWSPAAPRASASPRSRRPRAASPRSPHRGRRPPGGGGRRRDGRAVRAGRRRRRRARHRRAPRRHRRARAHAGSRGAPRRGVRRRTGRSRATRSSTAR